MTLSAADCVEAVPFEEAETRTNFDAPPTQPWHQDHKEECETQFQSKTWWPLQ